MAALSFGPPSILGAREQSSSKNLMHLGVHCGGRVGINATAVDGEFPSFLPKEVKEIKDPFARTLAQRIQRLPVKVYMLSVDPLHVVTVLLFHFFFGKNYFVYK